MYQQLKSKHLHSLRACEVHIDGDGLSLAHVPEVQAVAVHEGATPRVHFRPAQVQPLRGAGGNIQVCGGNYIIDNIGNEHSWYNITT